MKQPAAPEILYVRATVNVRARIEVGICEAWCDHVLLQELGDPTNMPSLTLQELVAKYTTLAGGFGISVPLADFGLSPPETERLFSQFDEDYHISRYFHFSLSPQAANLPERTCQINGFAQSHVSLDAEISEIL